MICGLPRCRLTTGPGTNSGPAPYTHADLPPNSRGALRPTRLIFPLRRRSHNVADAELVEIPNSAATSSAVDWNSVTMSSTFSRNDLPTMTAFQPGYTLSGNPYVHFFGPVSRRSSLIGASLTTRPAFASPHKTPLTYLGLTRLPVYFACSWALVAGQYSSCAGIQSLSLGIMPAPDQDCIARRLRSRISHKLPDSLPAYPRLA